MKLRDLIGSRNVVGSTANAFRSPVIVGCGSGGCGGSSCGGGGCGFTIVACGGSSSSCGGGGCSSYSYHHFGGCGSSSTSCGGGGCSSYSYHHFGCGSSGC